MALPDKKSQVIARVAKDILTVRLPALAIVAAFDVNGNPTLAIGSGAAGSQSAFVRVQPQAVAPVYVGGPGPVTDALGITQNTYGPHQVQLVLESSAVAGQALMSAANVFQIVGTLISFGASTELYLSANTVAVSAAGITGVPASTFDSLQYPGMLTT